MIIIEYICLELNSFAHLFFPPNSKHHEDESRSIQITLRLTIRPVVNLPERRGSEWPVFIVIPRKLGRAHELARPHRGKREKKEQMRKLNLLFPELMTMRP